MLATGDNRSIDSMGRRKHEGGGRLSTFTKE
jgi:hypothetical protein